MKRGTSYNIPKKMIYAVRDYSLNEEQLNVMRLKVKEEFKK